MLRICVNWWCTALVRVSNEFCLGFLRFQAYPIAFGNLCHLVNGLFFRVTTMVTESIHMQYEFMCKVKGNSNTQDGRRWVLSTTYFGGKTHWICAESNTNHARCFDYVNCIAWNIRIFAVVVVVVVGCWVDVLDLHRLSQLCFRLSGWREISDRQELANEANEATHQFPGSDWRQSGEGGQIAISLKIIKLCRYTIHPFQMLRPICESAVLPAGPKHSQSLHRCYLKLALLLYSRSPTKFFFCMPCAYAISQAID